MRKAYIEVLRAYPGRAFSSLASGINLCAGLFMVLFSIILREHLLDPAAGVNSIFIFVMALYYISSTLWGQFRQMVVNPSRRLSPGSVGPNLAAFGSFSFAFIILWPAIVSPTLTRPLGMIALATVFFAFVGFNVMSMSATLLIGVTFGYLWICFVPLGADLLLFLHGHEPRLAAAIIALSVVAVAIEVFCMIRMTEDDPRYHRRVQFDTWSLKPQATGEVSRVWAETRKSQPLGWPALRTQIYLPSTPTLLNRSRQWRTLTSGTLKGWLFMLPIFVVVFFLPWPGSPFHFAEGSAAGFLIIALLLNLVPPMSVSQMWLNQWRFLETESLRPMDRLGFFHELGLAVAIDLIQCWAVSAAAVVVGLTIPFRSSTDLPGLGFTILASGFFLVLEYGVVICSMTFRSPASNFLSCLGMMIFAVPIVVFSFDNPNSFRVIVLVFALLLAILGIFLIRYGRQMWMETELG